MTAEKEIQKIIITNENFKAMGTLIAHIMKNTLGGGSFSWNFSKGHYNKYGCEQSYVFRYPELKYVSISHRLESFYYDGKWYKGYYRKRGVKLFNFQMKTKEGVSITPENVEEYVEEVRGVISFIAAMTKIEVDEPKPLTPLEAGWDEFPQSNNFVEFREV